MKKVSALDTAGKHSYCNSIMRSTKKKKGLKAAPGAYDMEKKRIPEYQNDRRDSLRALRGSTSLHVTPSSSTALKRAASAFGVCSKIAAGQQPAFDSVVC